MTTGSHTCSIFMLCKPNHNILYVNKKKTFFRGSDIDVEAVAPLAGVYREGLLEGRPAGAQ
jgi:hypothetical protein